MKVYSIIIATFLFVTNLKSQSCLPMPVPFHDGFQGVTANSQWPPCWLGATMGTLYTFTSSAGSFAGCSPSVNNFFHSPEFVLNAGYTYSASMTFWQSVEGKLWNKVSLYLMKTSLQNLGLIASGTDFTTADSIIGGTFTVASTGTYYLGVEALKVGGLQPPTAFSFFDDIRVNCANNMIVSYPISVCEGEAVELWGSSANSFTFQNSSGTFQDNPHIDYPLADETYTVSGLIYGNCTDTRTISVKVDECVGLEENELKLNLYPNPFTKHLIIETESGSGLISIFNYEGNRVHSQTITSNFTKVVLIDFIPGVYILRYFDGSKHLLKKIICE